MPRKRIQEEKKQISITVTEANQIFQKYFKMMRNIGWGNDIEKAASALAIMYYLQQELYSYVKEKSPNLS